MGNTFREEANINSRNMNIRKGIMILIRADANENIGTGHVMRCISIAYAFNKAGVEVLFVTADHRGDGLLQPAGFSTICMDSDWTKMEAEPIIEIVNTLNPDLVLVDSYYVTEKYMNSLSSVARVAYIDDLNEAIWNVDYLINYNIYGKGTNYTLYKYKKTRFLLGPEYAPLRHEFYNVSPHIVKPVTNIMISAGGADPEEITEMLMKEICPMWPKIHFHFIIGALNPRKEKIKALEDKNIILHINEKNISELMKLCDVAISAAGTTLYELCACGIPTITYVLADNQLEAAKEFERQGIMLSAGDVRGNEGFFEKVILCLKDLIEDQKKRDILSRRMQTLVDGRGAERLTESLLSLIRN